LLSLAGTPGLYGKSLLYGEKKGDYRVSTESVDLPLERGGRRYLPAVGRGAHGPVVWSSFFRTEPFFEGSENFLDNKNNDGDKDSRDPNILAMKVHALLLGFIVML
jgi:hypothetical protein